jgi:hypothetical protein
MMSSSSSSLSQDPLHAVRLTSRQRESADKRIRMTRRRQELTSRIRKEKKSLYLQNKRSLGTTSVNNVTTTHNGISGIPSSLKTLLRSYCQSLESTSPEQFLLTIENFITTTTCTNSSVYENNDNRLLLLEQDDESLALQFLDCLRNNITHAAYNELSFTSVLKILVHFTSIDSSSLSSSSSSEYYGRLPLTWSELVVTLPSKSNSSTCPSWLEILVQALSSSKEVELTCLVLGNLVGDGSFRSVSVDFKESMLASLVRSVSPATPTAAWALTNMIQNDSFSYASSYCSETLLSTSRLSMWLQEPSIATQTAWMIASLTVREEQAVQYLCQTRSFLSTLVMSMQNPLQQDQTVPLMQALGNIACHASMITPLLTQTMPPLIPLLQQILSTTSSRDPLLVQVAWLSGCLLVDVGIENHPSTTCAAPALIPILMDRLGGESNCGRGTGQMTITMTTFEEEREFASALWNALAAPPIPIVLDEQQQQAHHSSQRMAFLTNHPSQSPSVHLPFNLNVPRSTLQTLVRLIDSKDCDAILASVHVVDLLLRREDHYSSSFHPHQNLQTIMQEEELPDALERVCDSSMEEAADIAADIIDNYFTNEQNSNEDSSPQDRVAESSSGFSASPSTFAFGIGSENRLSDGAGRGRGRGAMIPAWMTK